MLFIHKFQQSSQKRELKKVGVQKVKEAKADTRTYVEIKTKISTFLRKIISIGEEHFNFYICPTTSLKGFETLGKEIFF